MRIPAKGKTKRAVLAGEIIGKAKAAQQEIEASQRAQARLFSIAAQKEMAQFNYQLALDRMKFDAMMDLEAEKRAREWQLEKMEIASRIDFEQAERKRTQREEEYEAGVKIINESNLTSLQKEEALFKLNMSKFADYRIPSQREEDVVSQYLRQKMQPTPETPGLQLGQTVTQAVETAPSQQYQIGQTVTRAGKNYRIVGFDVDGEPLVNEM